MWYTTEADRKYYERLERQEKAKKKRREELMKKLPRRNEILQRARDGEITLKEAQAQIKKEERARR